MSTHKDSQQNRNPRLFAPCPTFEGCDTAALVDTCHVCGQFSTACCFHPNIVCHHSQVVYTDGACTNNGKTGAVSGLGIAFGSSQGDLDDEDLERQQFSIPVDDRIDPRAPRTSQRAELLAALHGLKKLCAFWDNMGSESSRTAGMHRKHPRPDSQKTVIVITTDSEYVVKGMTEWAKRGAWVAAKAASDGVEDTIRSFTALVL